MCSTSFKKVAQVLTPKIKNLFYDSNSKKTTPSCGISVKGDYKPGVCFHGYEIGCPASQTLPFFMNDFGPKYTEFTTTSHEQLPGHHLEVREATWCLFLLYILCVFWFLFCVPEMRSTLSWRFITQADSLPLALPALPTFYWESKETHYALWLV